MLPIINDRIENTEKYKEERYSKILGRGKVVGKDWSYYYIHGKRIRRTLRDYDNDNDNDNDKYDFRRAAEPSDQSECSHKDDYSKLKDIIDNAHKLYEHYER